MGFFICTNLLSYDDSLVLTITLPAIDKSLSNQVFHKPPPYNSTPTCSYPCLVILDIGFTLGTGESVCAPNTVKPLVDGLY